MRTYALPKIILVSQIVSFLSGCSIAPKTYKETVLDDMYPILVTAEYDSLRSLGSDAEVNEFLEAFWQECDSLPGVGGGTTKSEYQERLVYAKEHFPDRPGWGRSDRKRIYLQYGPPASVERGPYVDARLGTFSTVKSVEVWLYFAPGRNHAFPTRHDGLFPGQMRFVFGDLNGTGFYTLLYSSEDQRDIDARVFELQ